jgi:SPP1 family predicted phage head-tail adaptor
MPGKPLEAGRLRHIVTVQFPVETKNAEGEIIQSWTTLAVRWARVEPTGGTEPWIAGQAQALSSATITIRPLANLTAKCRIIWGIKVYQIISLQVPDEIRSVQILNCTEIETYPHFAVTSASNVTTGIAFNCTVTALDQAGIVLATYPGTVHFTSSDASATLPADGTLTNGVGVFSATLATLGSQTLTATDAATASITGNGKPTVTRPATHFAWTSPGTATKNVPFTVTVTALDVTNATAVAYLGTVHFSATDGSAVLPADSTLTAGVGTFSMTLKTDGSQTLTAVDTVTPATTGSSSAITVTG